MRQTKKSFIILFFWNNLKTFKMSYQFLGHFILIYKRNTTLKEFKFSIIWQLSLSKLICCLIGLTGTYYISSINKGRDIKYKCNTKYNN